MYFIAYGKQKHGSFTVNNRCQQNTIHSQTSLHHPKFVYCWCIICKSGKNPKRTNTFDSLMAPQSNDIPYHLMPIAAILGLYVVAGFGRTAYIVYHSFQRNGVDNAKDRHPSNRRRNQRPAPQLSSSSTLLHDSNDVPLVGSLSFIQLVVSSIVALIAYAFVVARVDHSVQAVEYKRFDPYQILQLNDTIANNVTVIKTAYRRLAQIHHPENQQGGDAKVFARITQAYRALIEDRGKRNFQLHGHPDGPLSTPAFSVRLPVWLWLPPPQCRIRMWLVYSGIAAAAIAYRMYSLQQKRRDVEQLKEQQLKQQRQIKTSVRLDGNNSVSIQDLSWLVNHLRPDSTHWDILVCVLTCPENIQWSLEDLERVKIAKNRRLQPPTSNSVEEQKQQKEKEVPDFDKLLDQEGWDEDEENNERDMPTQAKKNKGNPVVLLEGLDEGVLGQKWVEGTLKKHKLWPPNSLGCMKGQTFDFKGKTLSMLDHPGLLRLLCMTQGRLYAMLLNSQPQLIEAGKRNQIDQTYFEASMEFRQRTGLYLEAALRLGSTLKSYRLVATVVETVAMYKIGMQRDQIQWYNTIMMQQYNILPRLEVQSQKVVSMGNSSQDEGFGTEERVELQLHAERRHAELFTKRNVLMLKKQGILPEIGLRSYREGWWFLLRVQLLDGSTESNTSSMNTTTLNDNQLLQTLDISSEQLKIFAAEPSQYRLVTVIPVIFQNVNQKQGKINIEFLTPPRPGLYRYYLAMKSQEFFGTDQELSFDVNVLDQNDQVNVDDKKVIASPIVETESMLLAAKKEK